MSLKPLRFAEYQSLVCGADVLAEDGHGLKVLATSDDRIVKLFRSKRRLSKARLVPYALRFARNAQKLQQLGIPTVNVDGAYRARSIARDLIVYRRLEGETLRDVLADSPENGDKALMSFAPFLARLHRKGILFRSIHFGNVLVLPQGELGLIDVADLRMRRWGALTMSQRQRNFRHMLRYPEDRIALHRFGVKRFMKLYAEAAALPPAHKAKLKGALKALLRDPLP